MGETPAMNDPPQWAADPGQIVLFWSVWLVVVGLAVWGWTRRKRRHAQFVDLSLQSQMMPPLGRAERWSPILAVVALAGLILAGMDLRYGRQWREVPQRGVEVMFLLDVSRSMLAEDVSPNRLERAKQQIKDLVDEMAGDRVGLIAFAGEPKQVVPLTSHYEDFKSALDEVSPTTVRRGGSRLADAIATATDAFLEDAADHKAMIIFTDGGDQESEPIRLGLQAHESQGIRIVTVGLGDMDRGARIPQTKDQGRRSVGFPGSGEEYVTFQGQTVWSKMNGSILQQLAEQTGGVYVPAGTKRVDMAEVYRRSVGLIAPAEMESARVESMTPRYQWFAWPALLILLYRGWTNCRVRPAPEKVEEAI